MTPFLGAEDRNKAIAEVKEPITELLKEYYNLDPNLATVAYELGYEKPADLKAAIQASEKLQDLGLRTLATGGVIKREFWDNGDKLEKPDETGQSLFHKAARALSRGTPRREK